METVRWVSSPPAAALLRRRMGSHQLFQNCALFGQNGHRIGQQGHDNLLSQLSIRHATTQAIELHLSESSPPFSLSTYRQKAVESELLLACTSASKRLALIQNGLKVAAMAMASRRHRDDRRGCVRRERAARIELRPGDGVYSVWMMHSWGSAV